MLNNSQNILTELVEYRRSQTAPEMKKSTFFNFFVVGETLKDYDLSYDEIESGIVDRGDDGGIDSIHIFANGQLIEGDSDIEQLGRNARIELYVFQSKLENGFSEIALERIDASVRELLDLSNDLQDFKQSYNADLLEAVKIFRELYKQIALTLPYLRIKYLYCTNGIEVHPKVKRKAERLIRTTKSLFTPCDVKVEFVGASELLDYAQREPTTTVSLTTEEVISGGPDGYVCLVKLVNYFHFITDENTTQLRRRLLEANVRDYAGNNEVNRGIRETLHDNQTEDFWWLNNGITIIASSIYQSGKDLTLEDPQIVNGLQTSFEIFDNFLGTIDSDDSRRLLVRIVVPNTEESRDRIIRFTNSQTSIPEASLHATDKIHRDIEVFFQTQGLYYDRRKNSAKNAGRPKDKIISIPYLAQAMMAIVLREPDNARARPSSLIKRKEDYQRVFSDSYPIDLYLRAAGFMRRIDDFLRSSLTDEDLISRNNLKFHLAYFAISLHLQRIDYSPRDLYSYSFVGIEDDFLANSLNELQVAYVKECYPDDEDFHWTPDSVAKSPDFVEILQKRLGELLE